MSVHIYICNDISRYINTNILIHTCQTRESWNHSDATHIQVKHASSEYQKSQIQFFCDSTSHSRTRGARLQCIFEVSISGKSST